MQQVILEVMWHEGFFGESGISWDITVSAGILMTRFPTRASHNLSAVASPKFLQTLKSNFGGKVIEDLLHVY